MEHTGSWPDIALIRKKRKQLRITQDSLARISAVSQAVISRIEDGTVSDPSYSTVRRIFEGLRACETGKNDHGKTHLVQPSAGDLMNAPVITVRTSDRVKDACIKMKKYNFSQLPVVDDRGRVAGGIAENSFVSEDNDDIMEKRVDEVMRDIFPTVGRDTMMPTLASLLKTELAVLVLEKGKLAGIITAYDLMENAYNKNPGVIK